MMVRTVRQILLISAGMLFLTACKPTIPSQYLQPDELEDLLYDYYVAQGMNNKTSVSSSMEYGRRYNYEAVLKKHGITQAEFDSTLVYYYNNVEYLNKVYERLQKRLSDDALALGASAGEVERYATQSISGDTTDVWEGRRHLMLHQNPPYHIVQFTQKADTSFHQGDSFLLTFGANYLVQSGSKNATASLTITYDNDSVVSQTAMITPTGSSTVRIAPCDNRVKKIDGFFYLSRQDVSNNRSEMCLLFLDHIQLMRFHRKNDQ